MADIFVTGSQGFIGKHLMRALPNAIPVEPETAQCYAPDDTVIHLANRRCKTFGDYLENVRSMAGMLTKSVDGGKIVYLSSSVVYMDKPSLYKASKMACEELCNCYRDKLRISVIRPFNVYGPGQPDEFVIPTIINKMLETDDGHSFTLENLDARRAFVFVRDLVATLINPYDDFSEAASSDLIMIADLVGTIMRIMGKNVKIYGGGYADDGPHPARLIPDLTPMQKGLETTIEYYKEKKEKECPTT